MRSTAIDFVERPAYYLLEYENAHSFYSDYLGLPMSQSEAHIAAAVRACLARCHEGLTPIGAIAEFVSELRDQGWEEAHIHQVEKTVRRVWAGIVNYDEPAAEPA